MAITLAPYSHDFFQRLPSLEEAKSSLGKSRQEYLQKHGSDVIDFFLSFFRDAGMDRTFGLSMLHRHFDLDPNAKLVDYNGTATPWLENGPGMREPQPSIWAFDHDGTLKPTEFHYAAGADVPWTDQMSQFAAAFKEKITELGLLHIVGLARYPGDDFQGSCEITQGSANINLKPADYPEDMKQVDTIWYFSAPLWARGCRCTCDNRTVPHGHGAHVYTVTG